MLRGVQGRAAEFKKGDRVWVERSRHAQAVVIGQIDNHVMVRFKGCVPFVEYAANLQRWNPETAAPTEFPSKESVK